MAVQARVAVVTGANKGVGFGIVRGLCKRFDGDVILTSRDVGRGQEAVKQLEQEGLRPKFYQLDVLQRSHIRDLKDFLTKQYGGLDVLVNNAAIFMTSSREQFPEIAEQTVRTNFWAILDVCDELLPILKPHARVVNLSSIQSNYAFRTCSSQLRAKCEDPNITMDNVKQIMTDYVSSAQNGTLPEIEMTPRFAYALTKVAVRLVTCVHQRQLDAEGKEDILVNSCDPGVVNTDMTKDIKDLGYRWDIDKGAEIPLSLALISPNAPGPRGEFKFDPKVDEIYGYEGIMK